MIKCVSTGKDFKLSATSLISTNKLFDISSYAKLTKLLISLGKFFKRLPCKDKDYRFSNFDKIGIMGYKALICLLFYHIYLNYKDITFLFGSTCCKSLRSFIFFIKFFLF